MVNLSNLTKHFFTKKHTSTNRCFYFHGLAVTGTKIIHCFINLKALDFFYTFTLNIRHSSLYSVLRLSTVSTGRTKSSGIKKDSRIYVIIYIIKGHKNLDVVYFIMQRLLTALYCKLWKTFHVTFEKAGSSPYFRRDAMLIKTVIKTGRVGICSDCSGRQVVHSTAKHKGVV